MSTNNKTPQQQDSQGSQNPYHGRPDYAFWRRGVSRMPWTLLDPMIKSPIAIERETKVASAGSCFAQHIAKYLYNNGFCYYLAESCPPEGQFFSAQYGNIYTTRQLAQLMRRLQGDYEPADKNSIWRHKQNHLYVDAFRPTVSLPRETPELVAADRIAHLARVKHLFEEMEVFIFTLGLTECWYNREDGAVYPIAPGVVNLIDGPPDQFGFHNLTVSEIKVDFLDFYDRLKKINSRVKIILTVSPVPLAATYENEHILVANTYSKSALRVVAHDLCQELTDCCYFPSYEIFTGQHTLGRLYAPDLRGATPHGVDLAMAVFQRHFLPTKFSGGMSPPGFY